MGRKIIEQVFSVNPPSSEEGQETLSISAKDWKALVSRLDCMQEQNKAQQEKINVVYSKTVKWLNRVRDKLDAVSKMQAQMEQEAKKLFTRYEEKLLNIVQPEQRKEDRKILLDLMHRHTQFIQSYDKKLGFVKNDVSKNEYQLYQLLERLRTVRAELDVINRERMEQKQSAPAPAPPPPSLESLYSDLHS